jgi:hypothetical protein
MRYLKRYNNLFESDEYLEDVDNIVEILLDITDEFNNVEFKSPSGVMRLSDYHNKNDKYDSFKPVYKAGNKIRSRFSINFYSIKSYEDFSLLVSEMNTVIGRLFDLGWILQDMSLGRVGSLYSGRDKSEIRFSELSYLFFKPDVVVSDDLPKKEEIEKVFNNNTQLVTDRGDIYVYDKYVDIGFDAKTYDGDIPEDIDSEFQRVADILGFTEFERDRNDKWGVRFWYN